MEDFIADTRLHLIELQSSITLLKKALTNEFEEVEKTDINNYLQLVAEKLGIIISKFDKFDDNNM